LHGNAPVGCLEISSVYYTIAFMKMMTLLTIVLTTTSLMLGYAWPVSGKTLILLGTGLWLWAVWGEWYRLTALIPLLFVGLAGLGVWQGGFTWLMLVSVVAALVAWDLSYFQQRLQQAAYIENEALLQRRHWHRLAIVAGLGLLLGSLPLTFSLNLSLGWAIILGLIMVIGLGRVIGKTKREVQ
jgi:hypothetical protein